MRPVHAGTMQSEGCLDNVFPTFRVQEGKLNLGFSALVLTWVSSLISS